MATSVALDTASLPEVCTNQPKVMPNYSGKCVGGVNISAGLFNSASACWNGCWDILGEQTWYEMIKDPPLLCPSTRFLSMQFTFFSCNSMFVPSFYFFLFLIRMFYLGLFDRAAAPTQIHSILCTKKGVGLVVS